MSHLYLKCWVCNKPFGDPSNKHGDLRQRRIEAIKLGWRRPMDGAGRRYDICLSCRENVIAVQIWQQCGWENHWTWPRQEPVPPEATA